MKTFILSTFLFVSVTLQAQITAYFDYAPFYSPSEGTYVETYIAFPGNSFHYIKQQDGSLQASAEVIMIFKNVEEVKEYRKYNVYSPALDDTTTYFPTFVDLKRIALPQGVYNFELIIKDNYAPDSIKEFRLSKLITVNIPQDEIAFGGIEFIKNYKPADTKNIFVKNGYEYTPFVTNIFSENINYMRFYSELYNSNKEFQYLEDFLLTFHISNVNTGKIEKNCSSFQKIMANKINIIFKEIDISNLPTGNYFLTIEVRDKNDKYVISTKKFFQRINNITPPKETFTNTSLDSNTFIQRFFSKDSLMIYIKALSPICDSYEKEYINNLDTTNIVLLQQFFYNFWSTRSDTPEKAWKEYKQKLNITEQKFSTSQKHGYQTDRGRILLQYGIPNSVINGTKEENTLPYEIWQYYAIADLTDIKFIFYNKSTLPNDYELLNSTMKGELNNPNWEKELFTKSNSQNNIYSKAKQYFGN